MLISTWWAAFVALIAFCAGMMTAYHHCLSMLSFAGETVERTLRVNAELIAEVARLKASAQS